MVLDDRVRTYYREHPRMVSSPFGGITDFNETLFRQVLDSLEIALEGRRILDVGCGRGFAGAYVEGAGGRYTGIDFVSSGARAPWVMGDAARLPFATASFDGLFCIDAFEHLPVPDAAAGEMRRVLAPGGFVFLSAPNYGNVAGAVKWWYERFGDYARDAWAPFGRWEPQELERPVTRGSVRRCFERAGFRATKSAAYARDVGLGLCPWMDHPGMPEWAQYRLQRWFNALGPLAIMVWPGASLHQFWRFDRA